MKKKLTVLLICFVVLGLIGIAFLSIVPSIKMEPNFFEKKQMLNKLYNIDSIVLLDKEGKEYSMDIEAFRDLLPEVEYRGLLITKGENIEGKAIMNDGKIAGILISKMYPVLKYDVGKSKFNDFEISEKVSNKWFELVQNTFH